MPRSIPTKRVENLTIENFPLDPCKKRTFIIL